MVGEGPDGLGWATNWLPDGRLLITGPELVRVEPDGSRVRHADLSHISPFGWSEITVDGRGNVYVNTINFDFAEFNEVLTSGKAPGKIALVTPGRRGPRGGERARVPERHGRSRRTTGRSSSPSPSPHGSPPSTSTDDGTLSNRRVWADGVGPDGICLDADGCIWASSAAMANDCARIREGGEVLERIELDRPCFAAMLGGPDRRTLFMLTADWRGTEGVEDVVKAQNGPGARRRRARSRRRLAVTARGAYPSEANSAQAKISGAVSGFSPLVAQRPNPLLLVIGTDCDQAMAALADLGDDNGGSHTGGKTS